MAKPKSHSLDALLTGSSQLKFLTAQARQLTRLRDKLRRQLPPALASHCLGAELEAGTLVIYMDSAAAAMPVRYQQRELIHKLAGDHLSCTAIKVQILPEPPLAPEAKPVRPALSDPVRQILENTAANLEEGRLSDSLKRLARGRTSRQ
ncbi:MAG: DciA family protein [Gammaproteobacteria bacterium]